MRPKPGAWGRWRMGLAEVLKIRKGGTPETAHRQIYDVLRIPHEVMKPVKLWLPTEDSDGTAAQVPVKSGNP